MRFRVIVFAVLSSSAAAGLLACGNGDDTSVPTPLADGGKDGALSDATTGDAPVGDGESGGNLSDVSLAEATADRAAQDATVPSRLLLSYNGSTQSELVAFGLSSKAVDGRLVYPGYVGTTYITPSAPWLLEQESDVVARLDTVDPWIVDSSWNVAQPEPDAAYPNANPQAVVVATGSKAYVLPYNRNAISVLDTLSAVEGGIPSKLIDLGALVQPGGDGTLEMTAGVYVPGKNLVYVLLANIDQNAYNGSNNLGCAGNAAPTVIAIDTTTDTLVGLDGGAPGSGVSLPGRNPAFGPGAMAYDAVGDRLLVLQAGCLQAASDGGTGAVVGAEVDEIALTSGSTRRLLDLTGQPLPGQLVYMDSEHALLQLGAYPPPYTTYTWNPTTTALGSAIPNAPDSFAWDGAGNLLGVTAILDADSGSPSGYDVLSVTISDGTVTKLGSNPFSLGVGPSEFVSGVQLWPAQ
jgi:hypothetical protein